MLFMLMPLTSHARDYTLGVGKTMYFYGPNNSAIFFEASDPSVIKLTPKSVDSNNSWTLEIAGLKLGMSMFYFSYYNSNGRKINETHTIEVIDINTIKIPDSLSLSIGDTYQISPIIHDSRMKEYLLEWHSTNESVATIDNDYTKKEYVIGSFNYKTIYVRGGNITAKKPGTTTIYCTYRGVTSGYCNLKVRPVYVSDIKFEKSSVKIDKFETVNIKASILPDNANDKSIRWESSDPKIAFVDNKGNITGVRPGKTLIIATANDGSNVSGNFILEVIDTDTSDKVFHDVNLYIDSYAQFSYPIEEGKPYSVTVNSPTEDWYVSHIKLNGIDDIDNLHKNTYTIKSVDKPLNINVAFGYNHNVEMHDLSANSTSIITDTGVKISNENGKLRISNLEIRSEIKIYTIGGFLIGNYEPLNTDCIITLDPGIYLITVVTKTNSIESFKIKI